MSSTIVVAQREIAVIKRLCELGATQKRATVPDSRFSDDLRARLVAAASAPQGAHPVLYGPRVPRQRRG